MQTDEKKEGIRSCFACKNIVYRCTLCDIGRGSQRPNLSLPIQSITLALKHGHGRLDCLLSEWRERHEERDDTLDTEYKVTASHRKIKTEGKLCLKREWMNVAMAINF